MTLFEALVNQGNSALEARNIISEMRERMMQGDDPEELLYEQGLEPDYVMDLFF